MTDNAVNVGNGERALTAAIGSGLILLGAKRSGLLGWTLASLGGYLVYRGASGHCFAYELVGLDTAHRDIRPRADCSITIERPPSELYRFWRDFANLPTFMDHLDTVTVTDDKRSRWVAHGPLGYRVEWDAEIINEKPDELIVWRSLDGADVQSVGSVSFTPAEDNHGTVVKVVMQYDPPAGQFGAAAARLLGVDPASAIDNDLLKLKEIVETDRVISKGNTMSEKKRAKKDGHNTDKDRAAMRENVKQRKETAATSRAGQNPGDHDQPDHIPYKKGSNEDRTMRQGNSSV